MKRMNMITTGKPAGCEVEYWFASTKARMKIGTLAAG
jgi:hypothetical protein